MVKEKPEVQNLTADDSVPDQRRFRKQQNSVWLHKQRLDRPAQSPAKRMRWRKPTSHTKSIAGSRSPLDESFQVVYAWSEVPDYASWLEEANAFSDFVLQQACLDNRDKAWISELRPERRGFGRVQDLAAIKGPVTLLEARQSAAVLQTLFFQAAFPFNNAVPEWFRTHAVNVALDPIRFVTEAIQCLFAVEFIEWKKLTTGVFCEVTTGPKPESTTLKSNAPEDSPMTDAEASLLGTEFMSRFRVTGVRTVRRFVASSSDGESEVKRPHNAPSTPMSSVPVRSSSSFTLPCSSLDAAVGRLKIEDSGSSVVGPSGSSETYSHVTTSGTQDSSRESSTSSRSTSSMMSIPEGRVHAYAGTNIVMSIQAEEFQNV
ncbi:hypothetical protein PHMEG_00032684 [Phytophthora megakarya]|uniref:Uncharacterized protein n=1 Tax=Phytophthora megakarya TaxID=4795 RepID=A0A225UV50_9STRA|nr:hypothetical protein PHMEG_00032684 [Phytophthora megakarya]